MSNQQLEARSALAAVIARNISELVPTPGQCALYESDEDAHRRAHPIHAIPLDGDPDDPFFEYTSQPGGRLIVIDDIAGVAQQIADRFLGVDFLDGYEVAA